MTQTRSPSTIHDLIGVGIDPSSLALAIAMEEQASGRGVIGKQVDYNWHGDTQVAQSEQQISFLKDLVPLRWIAGRFADQCRYGKYVLAVEPSLRQWRVKSLLACPCDSRGQEHQHTTRTEVVSDGGTLRIPEAFAALEDNERVFHHARYLERIAQQPRASSAPMSVAAIGRGQSVAGAFIDLDDSFPAVQGGMIRHGAVVKPVGDSPFVNEVFAQELTDLMFNQDHAGHGKLIREYHNPNYSVVDLDLIECIYGTVYRQTVSGLHATPSAAYVRRGELLPTRNATLATAL